MAMPMLGMTLTVADVSPPRSAPAVLSSHLSSRPCPRPGTPPLAHPCADHCPQRQWLAFSMASALSSRNGDPEELPWDSCRRESEEGLEEHGGGHLESTRAATGTRIQVFPHDYLACCERREDSN